MSELAFDVLSSIPHLHIMGGNTAKEHNGIFSFSLDGVHPHDIAEILNADGVCIRAGHHCAQVLMQHMNVPSTVRASLAFYNREEDILRLARAGLSHRGINPSCGDDITLQLTIKDGVIAEGAYVGDGCAISQASADMMLDLIIGRTPEEALHLADIFLRMIKGKVTDEELEELEEAGSLQDISHMPARVKCAVLAWHTLEKILEAEGL